MNPGDKVIIHEPSFVAYDPIVQLAVGVPIPVEASVGSEFKLLPQQLEAKITDRTKLVFMI
ncbi:aminotransferase class I/II-fold pyridoxal phosphate-dependent enzyme [Virgibacillus necropolis]|uniref:aminotransferase class I/II-fold pyridoxal phosphate-dependent enzyme n=1 Tax=Virgibacillus necropolis TaxID=163877 RepID=UPI00384AE270